MNQHIVGRKIAGVGLGDRDSFVCILHDASGEVAERAITPTSGDAFE